MGPQIELLKHHRQVRADAQHLFGIGGAAVMRIALPLHRFTVKDEIPLLAVFQQVAAAQQRRFARTGRADQ